MWLPVLSGSLFSRPPIMWFSALWSSSIDASGRPDPFTVQLRARRSPCYSVARLSRNTFPCPSSSASSLSVSRVILCVLVSSTFV